SGLLLSEPGRVVAHAHLPGAGAYHGALPAADPGGVARPMLSPRSLRSVALSGVRAGRRVGGRRGGELCRSEGDAVGICPQVLRAADGDTFLAVLLPVHRAVGGYAGHVL